MKEEAWKRQCESPSIMRCLCATSCNGSHDIALLDNIRMCGRVVLNFDGSCDYLEMKRGQYIHHLNSGIGRSDVLSLVHFGAPPISEVKEIGKADKTFSLIK